MAMTHFSVKIFSVSQKPSWAKTALSFINLSCKRGCQYHKPNCEAAELLTSWSHHQNHGRAQIRLNCLFQLSWPNHPIQCFPVKMRYHFSKHQWSSPVIWGQFYCVALTVETRSRNETSSKLTIGYLALPPGPAGTLLHSAYKTLLQQ